MRLGVIVATVLLVTGCNGPYNLGPDALSSSDGVGMEPMGAVDPETKISLNQSPGRYSDYVDFLVQNTGEGKRTLKQITDDGHSVEQAKCFMRFKLVELDPVGGADLDDAVTGRRWLSEHRNREIMAKFARAHQTMANDPSKWKATFDRISKKCFSA